MSRFITFEGVEGAGKTTLLQALAAWLQQRGVAVLCTREPGGCALGEIVRHSVLHDPQVHPVAEAELLLMYAARVQHLREVIQPALAGGQWVLCDRFHDASHAYQGHGRGLGDEMPDRLDRWLLDDCLPHRTFLLDLPVAEGRRRVASRQAGEDKMERQEDAFFQRVRQGYLRQAEREPQRIRVLDAQQPVDVLLREAVASLECWL